MAVRFDASGDYLRYTTVANLPSAATHSFCCWVKLSSDRNDYANIWYLDGNNADGEIFVSTDSDGTTLLISDSATPLNLGTLTIGTWYFIGYARTNTARAAYIGTQSGGTLTKVSNTETKNRNTAYGSSGRVYLTNDIYSEWLDGEMAYARVWTTVALSDAEMDAEWRSTTAVRTSNLWAAYALAAAASAATDSGPNGYTLTVGGTLADGGANPTPPAPAGGATGFMTTMRGTWGP